MGRLVINVADAMVLGRKTYEGLAAVWPRLADDPTMGVFADRLNSMPKYVAPSPARAWPTSSGPG
jgi:dihydrofolate reductase